MKLKPFQAKAIDDLFDALSVQRNVVLKAPTGSGKTFIMANFVKQYLQVHPDTIFFWLVASVGDLISQTKETFNRVCNLRQNDIDAFLRIEPTPSINFISWDKINSDTTNTSLKVTEQFNFKDRIQQIIDKKLSVMVIIDESHRNTNADKSKKIFDETFGKIHDLKKIEISATPLNNPTVEIQEEQVIEAGLIRKYIYLNPVTVNDQTIIDTTHREMDDFELIDNSLKLLDTITSLTLRSRNYRPLLLIQLDSDNKQEAIKKATILNYLINEKGLREDEIGVWLSNEQTNTQDIKNPTSPVKVLIFKVAVATGWDCPRAQILCKLRSVSKKSSFEIQTLGRIRRMLPCLNGEMLPLQAHENEVLTTAYVLTNDEAYQTEFVNKTLNNMNIVTKTYHSHLDSRLQDKALFTGSVVGPLEADSLAQTLIELIDKKELWNDSHIFEDHFQTQKIQSLSNASQNEIIIQTMQVEGANYIQTETKKCFNHVVQKYFPVKIGQTLLRNIQTWYFNKFPQVDCDCETLLKSFWKWLYSNLDLLEPMLQQAKEICLSQSSHAILVDSKPLSPERQLSYKAVDNLTPVTIPNSLYQAYYESHDSHGEDKFMSFLKQTQLPFIRNGIDLHQDYCIQWKVGDSDTNFYPDYIVIPNPNDLKTIHFIEVKGGWDAHGKSTNIDPNAYAKLLVAQMVINNINLQKQVNYHVCFLRYCLATNQWYQSLDNQEYSEDLNPNHWIEFDLNKLK